MLSMLSSADAKSLAVGAFDKQMLFVTLGSMLLSAEKFNAPIGTCKPDFIQPSDWSERYISQRVLAAFTNLTHPVIRRHLSAVLVGEQPAAHFELTDPHHRSSGSFYLRLARPPPVAATGCVRCPCSLLESVYTWCPGAVKSAICSRHACPPTLAALPRRLLVRILTFVWVIWVGKLSGVCWCLSSTFTLGQRWALAREDLRKRRRAIKQKQFENDIISHIKHTILLQSPSCCCRRQNGPSLRPGPAPSWWRTQTAAAFTSL